MKLSKHFTRSEFACKCGCGQDTIDAGLIFILEAIREHFDQPITISSGNRCPKYNRKVGGAKSSQHLLGRAADIQIKDVEPEDVHGYIHPWHRGGLGSYQTFTHVDSRSTPTRW